MKTISVFDVMLLFSIKRAKRLILAVCIVLAIGAIASAQNVCNRVSRIKIIPFAVLWKGFESIHPLPWVGFTSCAKPIEASLSLLIVAR